MKLRLVVDFDPAAQRWAAFFPELPGCGAEGANEAEAILNARKALDAYLEPQPLELGPQARMLEIVV